MRMRARWRTAPIPARVLSGRWQGGLAVLSSLLLGLWAHPYAGIHGDARLYALQALARLNPVLSGDLFLRFGSQDRYSGFTCLYALLIAPIGLSDAALMVAVLSAGCALAGIWTLARRLDGRRTAGVAVTLLAVWPLTYGAGALFGLVETLATPRMAALGLALLGLGYALSHRRWAAGVALALALLLHPLIAAPVGLLLLGLRWRSRPPMSTPTSTLWPWLALIAGLLALMLSFSLGPMDPDWAQATLARSPHLSPMRWTLDDWMLALVAIGTPLLAARDLGTLPARVLRDAALIGAGGVLLTLIGGDLLKLAVIYQIQPWRTLWLSHCLGMIGIAAWIVRWSGRPWTIRWPARTDRAESKGVKGLARDRSGLRLVALIGAQLASGAGGPVLLLLGAMLASRSTQDRYPRGDRLLRVGLLLAALQVVAWRILAMPDEWSIRSVLATDGSSLPSWPRDPLIVLVAVAMIALAARAIAPRWRRGLQLAALASGLLLVAQASRQISAQESQAFAIADSTARVIAALPADGAIHVGETVTFGWFALRYPVYLSNPQTAGQVFFRETAAEAARRAAHLGGILGASRQPGDDAPSTDLTRVTPWTLRALCTDPALVGVLVRGGQAPEGGVPLYRADGSLPGWLVRCSDRQDTDAMTPPRSG